MLPSKNGMKLSKSRFFSTLFCSSLRFASLAFLRKALGQPALPVQMRGWKQQAYGSPFLAFSKVRRIPIPWSGPVRKQGRETYYEAGLVYENRLVSGSTVHTGKRYTVRLSGVSPPRHVSRYNCHPNTCYGSYDQLGRRFKAYGP